MAAIGVLLGSGTFEQENERRDVAFLEAEPDQLILQGIGTAVIGFLPRPFELGSAVRCLYRARQETRSAAAAAVTFGPPGWAIPNFQLFLVEKATVLERLSHA